MNANAAGITVCNRLPMDPPPRSVMGGEYRLYPTARLTGPRAGSRSAWELPALREAAEVSAARLRLMDLCEKPIEQTQRLRTMEDCFPAE